MPCHFPANHAVDTVQAFDTVIIGGGISGTLAATVLGRAGYRVCLIDLHSVHPRDFQAEHLDGAMIERLQRLDSLNHLTNGLFRGETVTVARFGRTVGSARTINFGLRYEDLVNRARSALPGNVVLVTGRATNIETTEDRQIVTLSGGMRVEGRLIVLATGQGAGLCRQAGVQRVTLREGHSLTFGFDIESLGPTSFKDSFIIYQREKVSDRIDYLAAFTMNGRTRVNLFTYRDYKEPWTKQFISNPDDGLKGILPGLQSAIGRYRAVGPVEARPIDLYITKNAVVPGVVLVGDAFQSSCPATGMGILRLLTDIEQLCDVHLPRWLETPGMDASKIRTFYNDPIKQACDAKSLHDAAYRRAVSTNTSLSWRLHRARLRLVDEARTALHWRPAEFHPRISDNAAAASFAPSQPV